MRQINSPMFSFFLITLVVFILAEYTRADVFLEDYETPPVQVGPPAGTEDGDVYVGIFDDPAVPNGLRATWGESGANSIKVLAEDSNQFVRLGTDVSLAGDSPPGFEGFVGILDHPTVSFFTYDLVGDFASLVEEPLYIGGMEISVDVRLNSDPGYPVYVRFLFTDTDGDEFVTRRLQVTPSASWQTIRISQLSLEELILLPSDGDGLWNGSTVFPVAVEVLIGAVSPVTGTLQLDIDNFHLRTRCLEPIPGDINNDCKVTFIDLAILAAHWLQCNLDPPSECPQ